MDVAPRKPLGIVGGARLGAQNAAPAADQHGDHERDQAPQLAGVHGKLDELFKEHSAYIARIAFRLLGREDEVDDIVQDVFITLFRNLERIRQTQSVRAWLATTTVRMVRRRLRVRRIGFLLLGKDRVDPMELGGSGPTGEDRAALWNIHRALGRVSVNARIAWVFRYLEQESVDEVARLCGCSRSTAKRRIAAAHRIVKNALADGADR